MRAAVVASVLVLGWTGAALGGPPKAGTQAAALSEVAKLRAAHRSFASPFQGLDSRIDPTWLRGARLPLEHFPTGPAPACPPRAM